MVVVVAAVMWWFCEQVDQLDLEVMSLKITSRQAETAKGVPISVDSVAVCKVASSVLDKQSGEPTGGRDMNGIYQACFFMNACHGCPAQDVIPKAAECFLGKGRSAIADILTSTLEGHQRQIIGKLTPEDLYQNRAKFSAQIQEMVDPDLRKMGFLVLSYTITDIGDPHGYMINLGKTQGCISAEQLRHLPNALQCLHLLLLSGCCGKAENDALARHKVAEREADAKVAEAESQRWLRSASKACNAQYTLVLVTIRRYHVSENMARAARAESDRDLKLRQAEYQREVNIADAAARAAKDIESEKQAQVVVRERAKQEVERADVLREQREREVAADKASRVGKAQIELEVMEKTVTKKQREEDGYGQAQVLARKNEAEATKFEADAVRLRAETEAYQVTQKGQAEASARREVGTAEADVTRLKGQAEADIMRDKAEAFKNYGSAAILTNLIPQLPLIAGEIAKPLSKTKEMIFISNDGATGSKVTGEIAKMCAEVPTLRLLMVPSVVESLTGVDLKKALKRLEGPSTPPPK
eukprot:gene11308-2058_t